MIVDTPTPCYIPPGTILLEPTAFDILIEHDRGQSPPRQALDEAKKMCGSCDVMAACFRENRDEPWVQAMLEVRKPPLNYPTCGRPRGANAHYRNGEQTCDACRRAEAQRSRERKTVAALAATVTCLEDIPDDLRDMHAAHTRHTSKGEPIPDEILAGERTYQMLKKRIGRANQKKAAA